MTAALAELTYRDLLGSPSTLRPAVRSIGCSQAELVEIVGRLSDAQLAIELQATSLPAAVQVLTWERRRRSAA